MLLAASVFCGDIKRDWKDYKFVNMEGDDGFGRAPRRGPRRGPR